MRLSRLATCALFLLPSLAFSQTLHLIPMPREVHASTDVPLAQGIRITTSTQDPEDRFTAEDLTTSLAARAIPTSGPFTINLTRTQSLPEEMKLEGYTITPGQNSITLAAASSAGLFYAAQTLKQLIEHDGSAAVLHLATIKDWPAMRYRGYQDDLSRGPISTLEYEKKMIRTMASYKVNLFSPYFEETQQYASNPTMAIPGASMSAADARELVAYATKFHVMVVPDQEAFGHLHHNLLYEQYQPLAETPHGTALAPGQPGSLALIHQMFGELAALYPSPFLHIGADETVDLGVGQTKSAVDTQGLGPVYLNFLQKIVTDLQPLNRRILFWGDIAQTIVQGKTAYGSVGAPGNDHPDPDLIKNLPASFKKGTIAVAWWYNPNPRGGFSKFLTPFTDAGIETWVATGVNSWSRIFPNNNDALANIQQFTLEGQRQHSTGQLNTIWYDDGEALANGNWYGLLFGAEAAWHQGEASIPAFEQSYAQVFHGDATGKLNEAQLELMECHRILRDQAHVGDGSTGIFWSDPWSKDGQPNAAKIRPYVHDLRMHAEHALTLIAQARAAAPPLTVGAPRLASETWDHAAYDPLNAYPSNPTALRNTDAIDALELGARRFDFIGLKFQLSDEIIQGYNRALIARASSDPKLHATTGREIGDIASGVNGRIRDLRDNFSLIRDLYEQTWLRSNRPYSLRPVLEKYDASIQLWIARGEKFRSAQRQYGESKTLPTAFDLGLPPQ
ncbi:beta-N-acetylhexosaminidase [Granulicella tundricola]|uniref:beta-N-acetylhexosaminidase n=1 Tax=Granulicella tundricola (strain ATCC BAA-1859 / DSM 23138 / MP5ACTX9) TaxID=1198114 RepID=E8X1W1_GRATM|nr:beta-N-acetylhexosaminidase [Granulicella tundricola]ADW69122.1 Glycoside hydrolase, family 20, catalytic core [Granulicella tundricola MP5ACTX9]